MNLAPIVLFVYNRPWHTRQTLAALSSNHHADKSELFIFADGPQSVNDPEELRNIEEVRTILREKQWCGKVTIFENSGNIGLAASIIQGVTKIINEFGRIIVLEDDLITSPGFLTYMNEALELYKDYSEVFHISAYIFPLKKKMPDTFFYNVNSCWGWGTWARAWKKYNNSASDLHKQLISKGYNPVKYNGGQSDAFYYQLKANMDGTIKTWAILWHTTIYINDGFCLHPGKSLVNNVGHDGTGAHSNNTNIYYHKKLADKISVKPIPIIENTDIVPLMSKFYKYRKNDKIIQKAIKTIRKRLSKTLFKSA